MLDIESVRDRVEQGILGDVGPQFQYQSPLLANVLVFYLFNIYRERTEMEKERAPILPHRPSVPHCSTGPNPGARHCIWVLPPGVQLPAKLESVAGARDQTWVFWFGL